MRRILLVISLAFTMLNTSNFDALAGPFVRPQPPNEPVTTPDTKPDAKKLDEAAATVTALKHCLAMDGSLNHQPRLIDAYNNQPDLEHLPQNMSDAEKEKVMLYTMGRPDIPDFGFLIPDIWRVTPRDTRIKFNAIISLLLAQKFGFTYGALPFDGNCKPIMLGDITTSENFEHATITMPLAFNDKEVKLTYLLSKQSGYNWQIDDLLIDNAGVANYVRKDLANAVNEKNLTEVTKEICKTYGSNELRCN